VRVWVDADSCPRVIRDIVVRASQRTHTRATFVANRQVPGIDSESSDFARVPPGDDSADQFILSTAGRGDLVVTRDIPLASKLVDLGICVLNDRGDVYTVENVKERLSVRDFMAELREIGVAEKRGRRFGARETLEFANAFDRELTRLRRAEGEEATAKNGDPTPKDIDESDI